MIAAGYDPVGGSGDPRRAEPANCAAGAGPGKDATARRRNGRAPIRLSENRMQRALLEARATGRLGTGIRNRDGFLAQLEGVYVDDDPAQGMIDGPIFTHPDLRIQFTVPPGLSDVERHRRGDDLRLRRKGPVPRRPVHRQHRRGGSARIPISFTRGQPNFPVPPPQPRDDQRHAGGDHDGACEQLVRRDRRQRRRLSMGCPARLLLRDADAGRLRSRSVRAR